MLVQRCERSARATDAVEATDTTPAIPAMTRDEALRKCADEAITASGVEGYQRKLQEMRYAVQLEKQFTKDEILLGYLNIANFGGVTYGIDAAAKRYFNVSAADLNIGQAAVLAGMVQNPNRFRIDLPDGSIVDADGVAFNKQADGSIDDVAQSTIQALYTLRDNGEITQEQLVAAADAYSETKAGSCTSSAAWRTTARSPTSSSSSTRSSRSPRTSRRPLRGARCRRRPTSASSSWPRS